MNAILIALLVALGLLIVISAYVSALCARGSRERYSLRVRDENEIGWMDTRGDLYRELCARRRARVGRVLMFVAGVSLLALLILLTTRAAGEGVALPASDPAALPADPFQRCAVKALRGDFGTLRPWQRDAYLWGAASRVHCCGVAKVTAYGHKWEAGGTETASGSRVHLGGCAANPELPFGTLIWTSRGLRYVTDRGGWVKVGYARVHGKMKRVTNKRETANLDYYTWHSMPTLRNEPWALVKIGAQTDRDTWFRPMKVESEVAP